MSGNRGLKLIIRGQKWSAVLLSVEDYTSVSGREGTAAVTDTKKRMIIFNPEDLDLGTVIHELVHAYFSAGCTVSADVTPHQTEELMAEMIAEFGVELIRVSRKLLKQLRIEAKDV